MNANGDGAWITKANLDLLTVWWTEDVMTTPEMAERLGCTKNALVGKAHRMGLPPKPNPARIDPARLSTHPKTVAERNRTRAARQRLAQLPPLPPPPPALPQPARQPTFIAPPPPVEHSSPRYTEHGKPCCWPIGEPGTKAFRYCDDISLAGKPYCAEHHKLAYVRIRHRDTDNSAAMGAD